MVNPLGLHAPQGAFAEAREIGAHWCRVMVPWGSASSKLDKVVDSATANGQRLIVSLVSANGRPPNDYEWLKQMAARHLHAIDHYQIENEWLWQWNATTADYLSHLFESNLTIKTANPEAKVICAALTDNNSNRPAAAVEMAVRLAQEGKYDIADVHCYSDSPAELVYMVEWLRQQMGSRPKPIWSLETSGPWNAFSEVGFARDVVQRYIVGLSHGVEVICWSSLKPTAGWSDQFLRLALIDTDGHKTPAYYTYRVLASELNGLQKVEQLSLDGAFDVIYRVHRNGPDCYVVWSDNGTREISRPWPSQSALVTHCVTERGKTEPNVERIYSRRGKLRLEKVSGPVFVEQG